MRIKRRTLEFEQLEDRTAPAALNLTTAPPSPAGVARPLATPFSLTVLARVANPVVTADFNENGIFDVAIANKTSKTVTVFLGRGDGTFAEGIIFPIGGTGPDALLAGDFSGRGHLDLASLAFDNNEIFVLMGNGDGTFQDALSLAPGHPGVSPLQDGARSVPAPLLGDAGGQTPAPSAALPGSQLLALSSGNGPQPTATTRARAENEPALDGSNDEHESALFLTSLGITVPLASGEGQFLPLEDVFVLNGPGFTAGFDLLAPVGEPEGGHTDSSGDANLEAPRGSSRPDHATIDQSALNSFRLLLDEVFRPDRGAGVPGGAGSDLPADPVPVVPCSQTSAAPNLPQNARDEKVRWLAFALLACGVSTEVLRPSPTMNLPRKESERCWF
jgi:hypothetical protein